ncbi:EpsG family protein [Vibrio rotiferianus]|uniref:EpsG family protein n=1 Tax=Vibrio rotiferianus TaxID=190895 RepID=UPI00391D15EC
MLIAAILGLACSIMAAIRLEKFYILLPFILMVSVFTGLRTVDTGTDTRRYSEIYSDIKPFSEAIEAGSFGYEAKRVEIGFVIFASFFKELSLSFNAFLIGISFLSISVFSYAFFRINIYPSMCIFLYTCSVTYLSLHFNIIRQGVAASFGLLAISYLIERKSLKFFLTVILAISFHSISLFYLLCPLLTKVKWKSWYAIVILFLALLFNSISVLGVVVDVLQPYSIIVWRVGNYLLKHAGEGLNLFSISLLLDFILILYCIADSKYLRENNKYFDIILAIFSSSFLLMTLFHDLKLLALRLSYAFVIIEPILVCYCFSRLKDNRGLFKVAMVLFLGGVWFLKNIYITAQFL